MLLEAAVRRAWKAHVSRILIDGSFVTEKPEPRDVDLVVRIGEAFARRLAHENRDAQWIVDRSQDRHPKPLDLFTAADDEEWASWVRFFQQDPWFGEKGIIEVAP
jgi:hypothetical protein